MTCLISDIWLYSAGGRGILLRGTFLFRNYFDMCRCSWHILQLLYRIQGMRGRSILMMGLIICSCYIYLYIGQGPTVYTFHWSLLESENKSRWSRQIVQYIERLHGVSNIFRDTSRSFWPTILLRALIKLLSSPSYWSTKNGSSNWCERPERLYKKRSEAFKHTYLL